MARFGTKSPASLDPGAGTSFRDILGHALGKSGTDVNAGDVEKLIALQGIGKNDAQRIRKGAQQVFQEGRDYRLGTDGTFNAFTPEARMGSSRAGGNKKGLNAGDLVGLGNNVSTFMGLVNRFKDSYHQHNAEVASGNKPIGTPRPAALPQQPTSAKTAPTGGTGGYKPKDFMGDLQGMSLKQPKAGFGKGKGLQEVIADRVKDPNFKTATSPGDEATASNEGSWTDFFDPRTADADQFGGMFSGERWRQTPDRLLAAGEIGAGASVFSKGARKVLNKALIPAQLAGVAIRTGIDAANPNKDVDWNETGDYMTGIGMQALTGNATAWAGKGAQKLKPLANKIPGVKKAADAVSSGVNKAKASTVGKAQQAVQSGMKRATSKFNVANNVKFPKVQTFPETNPSRMLNQTNPIAPKQLTTWGEKAPNQKILGTWGEPAPLKTQWSGAEVKPGSQNIKFKRTNPKGPTVKKRAKQMEEESVPVHKSGGKISPAELVRISPYKMGGALPKADEGRKLISYGTDGSEIYADDQPPVTQTQPGNTKLNNTIIDPKNGGGNEFGDSKVPAVLGKVAKYALPFIGEGLARQQLNNFHPPAYTPANIMAGTVYDMPRPDMGLRVRQPVGPDALSEIAGQKFADAQQRDKNYAFQTQNAASRIEQKQHVVDRLNQGEMMNAQGRNMNAIYTSQMLAQLAGAKYQSIREPFIAAQQHLGTDITTGEAMKADKQSIWAAETIRNPESSPADRALAQRLLLGKGKMGMKFKTKFSKAHA